MNDIIKEQLEFVEWLKNHKMYDPIESSDTMQKMFSVYMAIKEEDKK